MIAILSLPFIAVLSMGSDTINFLANAPSVKAAETQGFYIGETVKDNPYEWGNCTYWVFARRMWDGNPIGRYWGNANMWDESARKAGYVINHSPSVGAIYQTDSGPLGHVAYVVDVDNISGNWTISEMNAPHLNVVSTRTFSASTSIHFNFIHKKINSY